MWDVAKSRIFKWFIGKKPEKGTNISVLEQNGEIKKISISQTDLELEPKEFTQYVNYLLDILSNLERNYSISLQPIKPTIHAPTKTQIVTLSPLSNMSVPEMYFLTKTGRFLLHINLSGEIDNHLIDDHLISGFISAITTFTHSMGWKAGLNEIQSGDIKAYFTTGTEIIVLLISKLTLKLSHLLQPILTNLAKDLTQAFENRYLEDILQIEKSGKNITDQFGEFQKVIEITIGDYRKQAFELYQKLILAQFIHHNIDNDRCEQLIHAVSMGNDVVDDLHNLIYYNPQLKDIIHEINQNHFPIWHLFATPLFEIMEIDAG